MFTEEAIKRFRNPKNAGALKNYNSVGKAGDPECSDVIEMFIIFENDKIIDAKFKVFGCPGAVSTTDAFIDMIKGKTIDEASKISEDDISDNLGGLPTSHMHCSNLPIEAFRDAVQSYKKEMK
jgi:NifU-like protein involved in Fe-S cluster formation